MRIAYRAICPQDNFEMNTLRPNMLCLFNYIAAVLRGCWNGFLVSSSLFCNCVYFTNKNLWYFNFGLQLVNVRLMNQLSIKMFVASTKKMCFWCLKNLVGHYWSKIGLGRCSHSVGKPLQIGRIDFAWREKLAS